MGIKEISLLKIIKKVIRHTIRNFSVILILMVILAASRFANSIMNLLKGNIENSGLQLLIMVLTLVIFLMSIYFNIRASISILLVYSDMDHKDKVTFGAVFSQSKSLISNYIVGNIMIILIVFIPMLAITGSSQIPNFTLKVIVASVSLLTFLFLNTKYGYIVYSKVLDGNIDMPLKRVSSIAKKRFVLSLIVLNARYLVTLFNFLSSMVFDKLNLQLAINPWILSLVVVILQPLLNGIIVESYNKLKVA